MGRSLITEGCLWMLNVVELFQTGGLVDLVVDLVQLGLEEKMSIKSFLEGSYSNPEDHLGQRNQGYEMIGRETVMGKNLVKGEEIKRENRRSLVSALMTDQGIVIIGRIGTTEIVTGTERGIGKETGREGRDRGRDRGRDYERDRDRDCDHPRERDRDRDREKDYEVADLEPDRGRSRDREYDYDRVESKHERDRHGEKQRNYDRAEAEEDPEWYEQRDHMPRHSELEHDHRHYEAFECHQDRGKYDKLDVQVDHDRYGHPDRDQDRYDQMDEDNYYNKRATSEQRQKDRTRGLDLEYLCSDMNTR